MAGTNSGMLAEGTLFMNRLGLDGQPTGIKKILGLAKMEIKASGDIKEQKSKDKGKRGVITASVAIPNPVELSIEITNFDKESLAMAVMGDSVALSSSAGSATAESVTAKLNTFVPLANQNVTAGSVVVTNTGATVTYVENVDYEINYLLGLIEAKATITDAQAIKVTYEYGAIDGYQVNGSTVSQIKTWLQLDGRNLVDNTSLIITIDRALLTSDSALDVMSDDFSVFSMKGRAELLPGATTPFTIKSF